MIKYKETLENQRGSRMETVTHLQQSVYINSLSKPKTQGKTEVIQFSRLGAGEKTNTELLIISKTEKKRKLI